MGIINKVLDIASSTAGTVKDKAVETYDTIQKDRELSDKTKEIIDLNQETLNISNSQYLESALILRTEAENLDRIKQEIKDELKIITKKIPSIIESAKDTEIMQVEIIDNDNISSAIAGGVVGGAAAAGAAVALVNAFCVAGSGVAIANLSGIFAVKASLAALGGGALAAGGAGMAGGLAVLGCIFAVPAIAGGAYVWDKNVKNNYKKAIDQKEKIDEIVKLNDERIKNNKEIASKIRKIYDAGVEIRLFFKQIINKLDNDMEANEKNNLELLAEDFGRKGGFKFLELMPLIKQNEEILDNNNVDDILDEISSNFVATQNAANSDSVEIYTSKTIDDVFNKIFYDAEEFLYMTYPNYTEKVLNKRNVIRGLQNAIDRGVKIIICYGLIGNNKTFRNNKSSGGGKTSYDRTEDTINLLKSKLKNANNVEFRPCDSHKKICVCEKYAFEGSHNIMSYIYNNEDKRGELTNKFYSKKMINEYKQEIFKQERVLPPQW